MATSKPPVAPKPGRPQSSISPSPPVPYVQHAKRKSTLQNSAVPSPPSTPPLSAPPRLRSSQQPSVRNSSIVNGVDDSVPPLPERNQPKQLKIEKPTKEGTCTCILPTLSLSVFFFHTSFPISPSVMMLGCQL